MRTWLLPPRHPDPYQAFGMQVMHYTLLLFMGVAVSFVPFASSAQQLQFIPVIFMLTVLPFFILRTGGLTLAAAIFLGGLWLTIVVASTAINGILNASFSSLVIVIIFSAIFFSNRTVIALMLCSMLMGVVLVVGQNAGVLPLGRSPLYLADRLFQNLASFGAAGILLTGASRVILESMENIRSNEGLLQQRNAQLEAEIQERRRVESELRQSEARYRLLFENTSVMAGVYDYDGRIALINAAGAAMFGETPEALRGKTLHDILPEDVASRAVRLQRHVMETGVPDVTEGRTTLRDGREIYYLRHVMPLPHDRDDTQPRPIQVLVLTTDLTERHRATQRERDLAIANEKNAFFTDFFSTVSHDLKTPLTVLNTSLTLLERSPDAAYRTQKLAQLRQQVYILNTYIQDMLTISRLEYLPTLRKVALHVPLLVEEVVTMLRPRTDEKNIRVTATMSADLPAIVADEDQIRRALVNLVENAINYTPVTGAVHVVTHPVGAQVMIEVTDTGIGISTDDLPRIFDRFYRSSDARLFESRGTGLGLAIVKKIIDSHNGSIEVESEKGHGTTFRVSLPTGGSATEP